MAILATFQKALKLIMEAILANLTIVEIVTFNLISQNQNQHL